VYTQCPNCQTLFRIGVEQLKAADGKAHCCRCDQIFNALENLRSRTKTDESWPESRYIDNLPQQQDLPFHTLLQQSSEQSQVGEAEGITSSLINTFEVEDSLPISDPSANTDHDHNADPFEPDLDLSDLDMDSQQLNIEDPLSQSVFQPDSQLDSTLDQPRTLPDLDQSTFDPPLDPSDLKIDSQQFNFASNHPLLVSKPDSIPEFELGFESNLEAETQKDVDS